MWTQRSLLYCAQVLFGLHFATRHRRPFGPAAWMVLVALPLLGLDRTLMARVAVTDEEGQPASTLVGGYLISSTAAVDWTANPDATLALIGNLDDLDSPAVVLLPLAHTTMAVDEWLILGIDPLIAAQMIAALQPGESLSAVMDLNGEILSIVVTRQSAGSSSSTFVVTVPPQNPPQSIEETVERLRRMLQDLHDMFHPPAPPPTLPGGGPPDDDPNGDL